LGWPGYLRVCSKSSLMMATHLTMISWRATPKKVQSLLQHVTHPCCVACEHELMNDPLLNFLSTHRTRPV
jgi:hypothetical protein